MSRNLLLASGQGTGKSFCATDTVIDLVKNQDLNCIVAVPDTKIAIEYRQRFKSAGIDAFILASHESIFGKQCKPPKETNLSKDPCPFFNEIQTDIKLGVNSSTFKEDYCKGCPLAETCYFPNQYTQVMEDQYKVVIIQHAHFSSTEVIFKLLQKSFEVMFIDETFIQNIFTTIPVNQTEIDILESHTELEWAIRLANWLKGESRAIGKIEALKEQLAPLYEEVNSFTSERDLKDPIKWRIPDLIRFYNQHRLVNDLSGIEIVYEIPKIPIRVFTDATPPIDLIKHLTGIDTIKVFGDNEIINIKAINPGNHRYQIIDASNSKSKLSNNEYFESLMTKCCQIVERDFLYRKTLFTVYKSDVTRVSKFIEERFPLILPYIDIGLMSKGTNKWAHYDFQIIIAGRYRLGKSFKEDTYKYRSVANFHRLRRGMKELTNYYPLGLTHKSTIPIRSEPVKVQQRIGEELKIVEFPDFVNIVPLHNEDPDTDDYWYCLIDELDRGEMSQCERIRWTPDVAKLSIHVHSRFLKNLEMEPITLEEFLNL